MAVVVVVAVVVVAVRWGLWESPGSDVILQREFS